MPKTIDGGAYLVNEKWVDAEGKPLSRAQASEVQQLHDELAAARHTEEQERVTRAVRNDPMAQVLASALNRPQATEAAHPRGRSATPKDEA